MAFGGSKSCPVYRGVLTSGNRVPMCYNNIVVAEFAPMCVHIHMSALFHQSGIPVLKPVYVHVLCVCTSVMM